MSAVSVPADGGMVQRSSLGVGMDRGRKHSIGKVAARGSQYHSSVGEPSRY
jgi:hypothetical protein